MDCMNIKLRQSFAGAQKIKWNKVFKWKIPRPVSLMQLCVMMLSVFTDTSVCSGLLQQAPSKKCSSSCNVLHRCVFSGTSADTTAAVRQVSFSWGWYLGEVLSRVLVFPHCHQGTKDVRKTVSTSAERWKQDMWSPGFHDNCLTMNFWQGKFG